MSEGERSGKRGRPKRSTFGRGRGRGRGVGLRSGVLFGSSRRVVVRSRIIRHRGRTFRSRPLAAHVACLKREGVTRDGEKARMLDAQGDAADDKAFAEHCRDDRHHFRFIVSPEEATKMIDLKAFTRDLVADMEREVDAGGVFVPAIPFARPGLHPDVKGLKLYCLSIGAYSRPDFGRRSCT